MTAASLKFARIVFRASRTWVERTFANLIYFNEVDRGGHFAAWEEAERRTDERRN
jgi:hypothetical protein